MTGQRPVGRCIGCFHDFAKGPCGGCGAVDLPADLPVATDSTTAEGSANDCTHVSASGVDRTPIGPDKVWRCDHCGLCWRQGAGNPGDAPAPEPSSGSPMAALIERSSFGTPEAVALRASVSDEVAARVVARAKELELADVPAPEPSDRAGLSEAERDQILLAYRDGVLAPGQAVLIEVERILADRLAVAEQQRGEADRQREARDRWIGIAQQFQAKAEAAQQEAATLRAQVAAVEALATRITSRVEMLSDRAHYSSTADGRERNTWILAERELRAALGDSAQVVQRIKDEAADDALGEVERVLVERHAPGARTGDYNGGLSGAILAVQNERARHVRDGGE